MEDYNYNNDINEIMLFSIEMDDDYNTVIVGQSLSYCLNNICNIPQVKSNTFENFIYYYLLILWLI